MKEISFFVQGIPRGQPRPRAFAFKGRIRVYDPATAEGWKSCIAEAAKPFVTERITSPIWISCVFVLPRPKAHYHTGKQAGLLRPDAPLYHAGKPDIDNYEKAVFDALVLIGLIADDSLIVQSNATKIYTFGTRPGALITIRAADIAFAFQSREKILTAAHSLNCKTPPSLDRQSQERRPECAAVA